MKKLLFALLLIVPTATFSQNTPLFTTENIAVNTLLNGTLYTPIKQTKLTNLVILIAGSGPTNRDGNQIGLTNNSLKLLAESLVKNGIAVYSYDKRIFAQMAAGKLKREPNHEEIILEYKGWLKSASPLKEQGLANYRKEYARLKK